MAWRSTGDCPFQGVHLSAQLGGIGPAGCQVETAAPELPAGEARAAGTHGGGTWALVRKFICFQATTPLQKSDDFSFPSHFS